MKPGKILARVLASPANIRFAEMQRLVEAFGFRLLRVSASHHIYGRDGLVEQLNLQEVDGKAKPYQKIGRASCRKECRCGWMADHYKKKEEMEMRVVAAI